MTKDEKKELGRLLDKHRVSAVWHSELLGCKGGMYKIWCLDDNDEAKETRIYGKDLE